LARIELAELLTEVLRRDLRVSVVGEPEMVSSNFVNGVQRLEVELSGAR
jgi:hypothetical protein